MVESKMNKQIDALKLALEVLERCTAIYKAPEAITAIREALAEQPEFVLPGGGYIPATPCPRSKLQK